MKFSRPRLVFLDRDGVINRFPGKGVYVTSQELFDFLPVALEGIRLLTEAGVELAVVSNQGCVSRGLITQKTLDTMTGRMLEEIQRAGGNISAVYYCPHQTSDACDCRKPQTALFKKALAGRQIKMDTVYFLGDSEEDMAAGKSLGCHTILVLSGRSGKEDVAQLNTQPEVVKNDLLEAARWILKKIS